MLVMRFCKAAKPISKKAIVNRKRRQDQENVLEDAEALNIQRKKERELEEKKATLGAFLPEREVTRLLKSEENQQDGPKVLRLVIKCDVSGSVEAVVGALEGIGSKSATVKIVHSGVGDVVESDVMLAKAIQGLFDNSYDGGFNSFFIS